MQVLFTMFVIVMVPGAIIFVGYSFYNIRAVSKRPCNGELKQLAHLDGTIAKFHRVVKQSQKCTGKMNHI